MKAEYAAWIESYRQANPILRGACQSATEDMAKAFPELTRVPGRIKFVAGGSTEHWWLTAPDGEVIDPTVSQFEYALAHGGVEYAPWRPGDKVLVGRCMNCGDDIWRRVQILGGPRESVCGEECAADFAAYIAREDKSYGDRIMP